MEYDLILNICMIGTFSDIYGWASKQSEAQPLGAT